MLVLPIIEYNSCLWGYKAYSDIEKIQDNLMRSFLGVGRNDTIVALKPLSHGLIIRIRSGLNPDRIWISCVHTDRLIWINVRVETTFRGGFDPHLIWIKMAAFSHT